MTTVTSTSLLVGLREEHNHEVWGTFVDRYHPLLVRFARRLGLGEHDAEDAAQETLLAFSQGYREGKYDRDKGRLRSWLLGIATNKVREMQRRGMREVVPADAGSETEMLARLPDDHSMSEIWEAEWEKAVLDVCMAEVRKQVEPQTMRAFELFVLQEWPADKVAAEVGISRNAVFLTKRRVTSRMREVHAYLKDNW